jgi:hypothetical protein
MSDVDVKEIISATIKELQEHENQVQFKKPTTIQGWFYVGLAFCSVFGAIFTGIVFINNVITHEKAPFHHGTEELVEAMTSQHAEHATSEDLHRREEVLELKIAEEIKPIREKQNTILTNQATIQSSQAHFRDDFQEIREDVQRVQQSIDRLSDKISN